MLHADERSRRTENPRYGGFFEACAHSAWGLASTPVHGRRALHLEGDWCTFDSPPRVQRHPQVACCELRCHGVIPRTRRSIRSSALTVSSCEAVLSCPRPEGPGADAIVKAVTQYPNVLAVPTNMSEAMTGTNMDGLATRWARTTWSQRCYVVSLEEVRRKSHSDGCSPVTGECEVVSDLREGSKRFHN